MSSPHRSRSGVDTDARTASLWSAIDGAVEERVRTQGGGPLRIVDLGGGTGGIAAALAARGHKVLIVDPSPDALASASRRQHEVSGSTGQRISLDGVQGDAENLVDVLAGQPDFASGVDLVCCHFTLEIVDDPQRALAAIAQVIAPVAGIASIVVAGRVNAALARALAGQLEQAREILTSPDGRVGTSDPLQRRFTRAEISELVQSVGLTTHLAQGVRQLSDLIPSRYLDSDSQRAALAALEEHASSDADVLGHLGAHHLIVGP